METRIVVGDVVPGPDRTLLRGLAKGHKWAADLQGGTPISQIARREKVTEAYVRTRAQLAFLSPSIQSAILGCKQPANLTLEKLVRMQIPLDSSRIDRSLRLQGTPIERFHSALCVNLDQAVPGSELRPCAVRIPTIAYLESDVPGGPVISGDNSRARNGPIEGNCMGSFRV